MIAENPANLAEDISFLKRLAGEGRGRPAPMVLFLTGGGLLCGLGSLMSWGATRLELAGALDHTIQRQLVPIIFGIDALTILLLLVSLVQTFRPREGKAKVNRIAAAGWTAAFAGLVVIVACEILIGSARNNYSGVALLPSTMLILWGFAWAVSATATGQRWLYAVSGGSFVAALAWAAVFFLSVDSLLVQALSFLLLAFMPGLILMWRAKAPS